MELLPVHANGVKIIELIFIFQQLLKMPKMCDIVSLAMQWPLTLFLARNAMWLGFAIYDAVKRIERISSNAEPDSMNSRILTQNL